MKTKKIILSSLFILSLTLICKNGWAEVDSQGQDDYSSTSDDMQNYDSILKDLAKAPTQAKSRVRLSRSNAESFENTTIHAGVAYANMFQTLDLSDKKIYVGLSGVQVSLGIDLFSEHLSSEGTLMTFGDHNYDGSSISVKEFDLMFYGKGILSPSIKGKIGGGIASRYLTLTKNGVATQYSTPNSVLSVGADYILADALSLGGEIAMRNAMTGETIDERSYTMLIRLDTHF